VNSAKRYYVRFRLEVGSRENVFAHDYSAAGREVLMVETLADRLGLNPAHRHSFFGRISLAELAARQFWPASR
jgi:hypothetical protein